MKITATIANDENPQGWVETWLKPEIKTEESAKGYVEGLVSKFNRTLNEREIPRRIIQVTLTPLADEDCFKLGRLAFLESESVNPFSPGSQHDAWQEGWDDADAEEEESLYA